MAQLGLYQLTLGCTQNCVRRNSSLGAFILNCIPLSEDRDWQCDNAGRVILQFGFDSQITLQAPHTCDFIPCKDAIYKRNDIPLMLEFQVSLKTQYMFVLLVIF